MLTVFLTLGNLVRVPPGVKNVTNLCIPSGKRYLPRQAIMVNLLYPSTLLAAIRVNFVLTKLVRVAYQMDSW